MCGGRAVCGGRRQRLDTASHARSLPDTATDLGKPILPWSDEIPVVTYFQSLGVFWVLGRKDTVWLWNHKDFHKKNPKDFSRFLMGLRRLSVVWHKYDDEIWSFFRQNRKRSFVHQSIKQLLATRNKEELPFCLGLYRWEGFALLLHLWC